MEFPLNYQVSDHCISRKFWIGWPLNFETWLCHYRSHLFPFGSFLRVRFTFNILQTEHILFLHSLPLPDLPDLSFAASHWHPNPKLSQFCQFAAAFASAANERIHSKTLSSCVARPVGPVVATMRLCYTQVFEVYIIILPFKPTTEIQKGITVPNIYL